jgi:hypothetical protein
VDVHRFDELLKRHVSVESSSVGWRTYHKRGPHRKNNLVQRIEGVSDVGQRPQSQKQANFFVVFGAQRARNESSRAAYRVSQKIQVLLIRNVQDVVDGDGEVVITHFFDSASRINIQQV